MADNFAWAAGLFEGEGYVTHRSNGRGATVRGLGLSMTDRDVVERFAAIVGVGSVKGPHARPDPRHKPLWRWWVSGWERVQPLAERLLPWMGERRATALTALLADPPWRGKWQTACSRCGAALAIASGDSGRRCPNRRAVDHRKAVV